MIEIVVEAKLQTNTTQAHGLSIIQEARNILSNTYIFKERHNLDLYAYLDIEGITTARFCMISFDEAHIRAKGMAFQ
jgi:hypothetical protein